MSAPPGLVVALIKGLRSETEETEEVVRAREAVEVFRSVGRWIPRYLGPFVDLRSILCAGIPRDEPAPEIDTKNFERIIKLHPYFPDFILALNEEDSVEVFEEFVSKMLEAMCDARAQDTNTIKSDIMSFLPIDWRHTGPPAHPGSNKSSRGFNNLATGEKLCPLRFLPQFLEDPIDFKNKVENAEIILRARDETDWPSFLYPDGTVFDPANLDSGLFRGHVFIRSLRTIYTGRSSAFTGYRAASKRSQAEIHGMSEVFPEAVAYAAVQAYHGLSSVEQWGVQDRHFKLDTFFRKCVKLFTADPDDAWVTETLDFLTGEMPALKRRPKRHHPEDMSDDGSDNENGILAQRAAKRKAAQLREADQANQMNNNHGGGIPRQPLSPPSSSPGIHPPRSNHTNESRESPLNDLTPSPGPPSDNGGNQSPSTGPPPANPFRHPVNRALVRRPLILRFSANQNVSATATAHGHSQTQPPNPVEVSGGPRRPLPPTRFGPTRNSSPTPSVQSPHRQTQPLASTSTNRPRAPDNLQTAPKQKILIPAKKSTKTRASRKRN